MTKNRFIVKGYLEALSPVALRTGNEEDVARHAASGEPNAEPVLEDGGAPAPVAAIELDHRGYPFLPGSSLKGLLRSLLALSSGAADAKRAVRLFGDLPKEGRDPKDPLAKVTQGGVAEFRNSPVADPDRNWRPAIRGRTALHEGTRTAEDGQLRHDRMVAPGTRFAVTIVLDRAEEDDVRYLLGLLALLDGQTAASSVGAGTTQGDGRVVWMPDPKPVLQFGSEQAARWLASTTPAPWSDFAVAADFKPSAMGYVAIKRATLDLKIEMAGHFLVGAQEIHRNAQGIDVRRVRPYRVSGDDDSTARLAGSTLDGALRAQARKIYRTISGDLAPWADDDTELPEAIEALFGSAKCASLLETETFLCTGMQLTEQEFVAVDRFSGGAATGAQFTIRAFEAPTLEGRLSLVLERKPEAAVTGKAGDSKAVVAPVAAVGLLALTVKDLACGDVPLGHATRKGYGQVARVTGRDDAEWPSILEDLGRQVLEAGILPKTTSVVDGRSAIEAAVSALHQEASAWALKRANLTTPVIRNEETVDA